MTAVDDLQDARHFAAPERDVAVRDRRIALLPAARRPAATHLLQVIVDADAAGRPATFDLALAGWREQRPRATELALWGASDDLEALRLAAAVHQTGASESTCYELGCLTRPSPEPTYVRLALVEAWRSGLLDPAAALTKADVAARLGITAGSLVAGLESCRKRGLVEPVKAERWTWRLTDKGLAEVGRR